MVADLMLTFRGEVLEQKTTRRLIANIKTDCRRTGRLRERSGHGLHLLELAYLLFCLSQLQDMDLKTCHHWCVPSWQVKACGVKCLPNVVSLPTDAKCVPQVSARPSLILCH